MDKYKSKSLIVFVVLSILSVVRDKFEKQIQKKFI
jgi:hypothetical protein